MHTTIAPPIPYAPIARHAVIGDRRTAALVAADGTIDWLCLPDYDGEPAFAALLDAERGGSFRFGPQARAWGEQSYVDHTAVAETRFTTADGEIIARDAMILPDDDRRREETRHRVVVRHLRGLRGAVPCTLHMTPRAHGDALVTYFTHAPSVGREPIRFDLRAGEEAFAVLAFGDTAKWTGERARAAVEDTLERWRRWSSRIQFDGARRERVLRSLLTIRLLGYAPNGSLVAAATTSIPERIGGAWNSDYRFAWVRDASLSLQALAEHGDGASARRYFEWLNALARDAEPPLRVLYGIDGRMDVDPRERRDFAGYRGSTPVRFGNHAYRQKQLGMFGFLADCALAYHRAHGDWRADDFDLIAKVAEYTRKHWRERDNGIWELAGPRDHVSSRVMSWVALMRAAELADALGRGDLARAWRSEAGTIHREVLDKGYSPRIGAFRQEYESDALDASALLIPIMRFLPGDDPRVVSTVDRIADELTINGLVHRFVPNKTPCASDAPMPMGEFEGSFVLCTCWLASAYAIGGRTDLAEATLARIDKHIGPLGLLPEGIDARTGELLGNFPLLFAHAEYVRAVVELARATRSVDRER